MRSDRNEAYRARLLDIRNKYVKKHQQHLKPGECLSDSQLTAMYIFNNTYHFIEDNIESVEHDVLDTMLENIVVNYRKFMAEILSNFKLDMSAKDQERVRDQITLWVGNIGILTLLLQANDRTEEGFILARFGYKELKKLLAVMGQSPVKDLTMFKVTPSFLNIKLSDFAKTIGNKYYSDNELYKASIYYLQALDYLEEGLTSDVSGDYLEWLNAVRCHSYLDVVKCKLALDDVCGSFFYLKKCKYVLNEKYISITDINNLPGNLSCPDSYLPVLSSFLDKLFEFDKKLPAKENVKHLINECANILPDRCLNPELYDSVLAKILSKLLDKVNYMDCAFEFCAKLKSSKIAKYKKYADNCEKYLLKQNKKILKEHLSELNHKYSKTQCALSEENFSIKLLSGGVTGKRISSQSKQYQIVKTHDEKYIFLKHNASIVEIEQLLQAIDKVQIAPVNETPLCVLPKIDIPKEVNKEESKENEHQREASDREPRKETKKGQESKQQQSESNNNNPAVKTVKKETEFSEQFDSQTIYPIGRNAHYPDGVYYGFFNYPKDLEAETRRKFENVLINGKIGYKCPSIKPVKKKKDTFKLAPCDDLRMFSSVAERTSDGKILLEFNELHDHTSQKVILK